MLSEKVIDLGLSFDALKTCNAQLAESIRGDADLQVFIPGFDGAQGEARELAINSIARLMWPDFEEPFVKYGVLLVSPKTVDIAQALNEAKADFKVKMAAIKEHMKESRNTRLAKDKPKSGSEKDDDVRARERDSIEILLDRALNREGSRTPELSEVLGNMRLSHLDIKKCYAAIRVLPESIRSLSYTWAVSHSAISKTTVKDAIKMAELLEDSNLVHNIKTRLANLNPQEIVAIKKELPNQLRANIVFSTNDETKRMAITVSGFMLCVGYQLPLIKWRDEPTDEEKESRLQRADSIIQPRPLIKALNLYRYVNPKLKDPEAKNEE